MPESAPLPIAATKIWVGIKVANVCPAQATQGKAFAQLPSGSTTRRKDRPLKRCSSVAERVPPLRAPALDRGQNRLASLQRVVWLYSMGSSSSSLRSSGLLNRAKYSRNSSMLRQARWIFNNARRSSKLDMPSRDVTCAAIIDCVLQASTSARRWKLLMGLVRFCRECAGKPHQTGLSATNSVAGCAHSIRAVRAFRGPPDCHPGTYADNFLSVKSDSVLISSCGSTGLTRW